MEVKRYSNLIIFQYKTDININTIELIANPFCKLTNNILLQLNDAFNINTAIGQQLDILGQYIGLKRNIDGIILDDNNYRFFLKLRIIRNKNNHNDYDIKEKLNNLFNGSVILFDNRDMTIDYLILQPIDPIIENILKNNKDFLPAPAGVGTKLIINAPDNYIFGFMGNDSNQPLFIAGFSGNTADKLQDAIFLNENNIINI